MDREYRGQEHRLTEWDSPWLAVPNAAAGDRAAQARHVGEENAAPWGRSGAGHGMQPQASAQGRPAGHQALHEDDPHYARWRDEYFARCDADYSDWQRQRAERFAVEFEVWRRTRGREAANRGYEEPSGRAAGAGASASGHPMGGGEHASANPNHPYGPGDTQNERTELFFERS